MPELPEVETIRRDLDKEVTLWAQVVKQSGAKVD